MRINAFKRIGIETIYDLITHFPRRIIPPPIYCEDIKAAQNLTKEQLADNKVMIYATISKINSYPPKGRMRVGRLVITAIDEIGTRFEMVYFAASLRYIKWLESRYRCNTQILVIGKPSKSYNNYCAVQFNHPEIEEQANLTKEDFIKQYLRPRTVYGATARLRSTKIHETILHILPQVENELVNIFTSLDLKAIAKSEIGMKLCTNNPLFKLKNARATAFRQIHNPKTMAEYELSLEYLRFEEAFLLQTMLQLRTANNQNSTAIPRPLIIDNSSLITNFKANLPWSLTNAQEEVFASISTELDSTKPMQRLVQGDVGSGKTVVAMLAMLQIADNGGQSALLAPTEVLASQHFETITNLLGKLYAPTIRNQDFRQLRVELLTSKTKSAVKRRILGELKSGEIDIIIGTHSLLHNTDQFNDLGLVVVDEQHRFGALQRNQLRENRTHTPHLLALSATPIPRSIAMTYFADLDISTINEMPAGRGKVDTFIIQNSDKRYVERMWQRVREEIDKKHNVFIVVPRIDNDDITEDRVDKLDEKKVNDFQNDENDEILEISANLFMKMLSNGLEETLDKHSRSIVQMQGVLNSNPLFKDINIGILHGRLSTDEKQKVMRDFAENKTQILLSTTVVEVGIDIPNASVMLICDADKFGLSTLHQLRGRVGRGGIDGICFLLTTQGEITIDGEKRLQTIKKTRDGFEIANDDLKIRGIGDVISARQSGNKSSLRLVNVSEHLDLITLAATTCKEILSSDPNLIDHDALVNAIKTAYTGTESEFIVRV